jgi:hypothetical protein
VVVAATAMVLGVSGLLSWLLFAPSTQQMMAAMTPPATVMAPATATAPTTTPAMPPLSGKIAMISVAVGLGFVVMLMVLLPAVYLWFFTRPATRHTYDYFDPQPDWTDRTPTPTLALSFWLAVASLAALNFIFWGVVPVFGTLVTGVPAAATLVAISVLLSVLSLGVFRLSPAAWWATGLLALIAMGSAVVTFARLADPLDFYRAAGSSPEQLDMMRRMGATARPTLVGTPMMYGLALLAYLLWIRRYFTGGGRRNAQAAADVSGLR